MESCSNYMNMTVLWHLEQKYDFHAITTNKGSAQAGRSLHGQHVKTAGCTPAYNTARIVNSIHFDIMLVHNASQVAELM